MKKIIVVLLFAFELFAQQQNSPIRINYDVARFRGDDGHSYVEVYYAFDVSSLKYVSTKTNYQSEVMMSATFKRSSDDSVVARQAWRIPFSVNDTTMLESSRSYIDVFGFMLKPDIYRMYLVAVDMNDPRIRDSISVVADITLVPADNIALSDVELSMSIQQIERDSSNRFYKNTFEVKPYPSKIFGIHQPALFYYLESYNLKLKSSDAKHPSDSYLTKAVVTNAVGKEVINHEKTKKRTYDSNVEVGMMKIVSLRTGAYTFTYTIYDTTDPKDASHKTEFSSSKRFFVYNPNLPMDTLVSPTAGNVDATVFATMTEEEIDREFQQVRYIATKDENDRYKQLKGLDAKRRMLYDFWEARDEDKTTPVNEQRQEYIRRVVYANNQYKTGFREGWKSDRGRVYIIYGPPDEIERHANETDVKPYEIWYFNSIQGGVQFIFGDRTGFSDYILLHSTHRNEIRDENWRRQIQAN